VRVLKKGTSIPGDNVYLTIDSKIQKQVAQDLGAALAQLHLRKGVAILEGRSHRQDHLNGELAKLQQRLVLQRH